MDKQRFTKVQEAIRTAGLDLLILIPGSNMKYVLGFSPMLTKRMIIGIIPVNGDNISLVLPALEAPGIRSHIDNNFKLYTWEDATGALPAADKAFAEMNLPHEIRIGVEYTAMRVNDLKIMEAALGKAGKKINVNDANSLIGKLRMVKSPAELELMQKAAAIVEEALYNVVKQIKEGITETEVAELCRKEMKNAGADGESFESFAGFGENTANPHHEPGNRKLKKGDLVMIDFGAYYKGYASDITRTFAFGEPGEKAREIYDAVKRANEAGKAAAKPGATGEEIDKAARDVIKAAGYGPQFLHRTGHGLGMEIFPVHEYPDIVEGAKEPLLAGTTFTVEPGIYVEGVGGVRIEDDVAITENGCQSLTKFERELIILPV